MKVSRVSLHCKNAGRRIKFLSFFLSLFLTASGSLWKLIGWNWEYCSLFCWYREMCLFFPKSFWRNKKGRKTPHFSGLTRFKYQPLLAFHWCSAAFARLFWEPLQHTNLQSADTYAVELKVFFIIKNLSEHPYASCTDSGFCQSYPLHFISLQQLRWGIATARYQIHSTDELAAWRYEIFYYFHNYSVKKLQ